MTRKMDGRDDPLEVTQRGSPPTGTLKMKPGQKWGLLLWECTMTMSNVCWFITITMKEGPSRVQGMRWFAGWRRKGNWGLGD
jgi:hypothetical protein